MLVSNNLEFKWIGSNCDEVELNTSSHNWKCCTNIGWITKVDKLIKRNVIMSSDTSV